MKDNMQENKENDQQEPVPNVEPDYWRSTLKGRVVYDRKKHYFKAKDMLRIWNSIKHDVGPEPIMLPGDRLPLETILHELLDIFDPGRRASENQVYTQREINQLERLIQEISIDMVAEMLELIPGINKKIANILAESVYWSIWNFLNNLLKKI